MLFRKKIEPRCSYCARGGRANDHEVICAKKGIVPAESHCGAFRYDPLKRVPPRPAKLETEELRQEVRRINRLLAGKGLCLLPLRFDGGRALLYLYRPSRLRQDLEDAEALMGDPDMKELAQEEYQQAREELARLEEEIKVLLLPRDPNDDKNVIVEIRAGVGGEEAALFAHSLFRMYSMYADARRWRVEVDSVNETELGGVKEICFTIEGDGAWSRLPAGFEI